MQTGIYIIFALLIGVVSSIYMPMNASVAKHLGLSLTASISFYFVALATSVALFIFFGEHDTIYKFKSVPPYLLLTGVFSAFIVLSITFLIPILGVRKLTTLTIAGSIITAMVVSHFGMLTSPVDPITIKKLAGASLLFLGAVISIT
ncbi:MAG: transporter family-2 protein [Oceanospirillaceae bacterium]|jgi:transporter family-2 protein